MAFKSQKPLKRKVGLKQSNMKARASKPMRSDDRENNIQTQKIAPQKQTLRLLEKARIESLQNGVALSEWEDSFLSSVSERVKTFGRAFADPDLGAMGGTLSLRQGLKLKEIRKKAKKTKLIDT